MPDLFNGFQSLVENSPDAISVIDRQGQVLYSSAANRDLFGYNPSELVGRDCMERIHPEDQERSSQSLQEVMVKPPGPCRWDARIRCKDGNYCWVESTVSNLLSDLEVHAIVLQQRNIHDRRVAEETSRAQTEELRRSNLRMEEFAYTVAHDLREPLHAMSAYTELLAKTLTLNDETRQMFKFLAEGTSRMSLLVTDLLSFASTGMHAPPRMVDLNYAFEEASKNLALEIQQSGAVVTAANLPSVLTDETHLIVLFQNLISNAIKYRREEAATIHLSAEQNGANLVVKVRDNGLGIASESCARVFLPFIRLANRKIPGTGLGLAVCKKIVEGFGGTIWVDSEVGIGSTFTFTIPVTSGAFVEPLAYAAVT